MKIIAVDDIKQNTYLLQKLLEGYGYAVETASNGVEALEKARMSPPPDMIITDVLMPKMDGFQLCRELKKDEKLKDIPVLFYSGTYTDKKSRELALSISAAGYIVKPTEPDEFIKIVKETFEKYEKGEFRPTEKPLEEEVYMKLYNERLIQKLEKKMLDLEKSEKRIRHLNSVLKAIRNVNQLIIVEKDRDSLLQKACDVLIVARGYDAACLGFLRDGETFAMVKGSGFGEDFSRFREHLLGGEPPPCFKNALAQKVPFMRVDKSTQCGDCFFKNAHTDKEVAIIRVEHAGKLFGLLAISLASDVAADEEEKGILREAAGDIGFALHDMEMEGARKRAEEELVKERDYTRHLIESSLDFQMTLDKDGIIMDVNEAFEKIVGKGRADLIGASIYEYLPKEEIVKAIAKIFDQEKVRNIELTADIPGKEALLCNFSGTVFTTPEEELGIYVTGRDITEQRRAEDQIKASLKEKEVLLLEIHHRVKNSLQVVSSLLNMQARAAKDKNVKDILSESRNRINTMALIHSQLYESGNLSEIDMKGFMDKLLVQLLQIHSVPDRKITPIVHAVECSLPISTAVPVGLIANELLSNVFKHAFVNRKEGKIEVSLSVSKEGEVSLTVSDDGVGLPEGFDVNTTKTLGLHVVKILVEDQLLGNLEVVRDKGTTFKVEFRIVNNELLR